MERDVYTLLNTLKNRKKQKKTSSDDDAPYFSMEDVRRVLRDRENEEREQKNRVKIQNKQKLIEKVLTENKGAVISAAGIADILGFNPMRQSTLSSVKHDGIDAAYETYYVKLLQLKEALENKMNSVPPEIEFAWSLLKNEIEWKKEIQDAIDRIRHKTYGICEMTGEKITTERLEAIPFTRYSTNGQKEYERKIALKKEKQSGSLFMGEPDDGTNGVAYDEPEDE